MTKNQSTKPEWATFTATDKDGKEWWYGDVQPKPAYDMGIWNNGRGRRLLKADTAKSCPNWGGTLRKI